MQSFQKEVQPESSLRPINIISSMRVNFGLVSGLFSSFSSLSSELYCVEFLGAVLTWSPILFVKPVRSMMNVYKKS